MEPLIWKGGMAVEWKLAGDQLKPAISHLDRGAASIGQAHIYRCDCEAEVGRVSFPVICLHDRAEAVLVPRGIFESGNPLGL